MARKLAMGDQDAMDLVVQRLRAMEPTPDVEALWSHAGSMDSAQAAWIVRRLREARLAWAAVLFVVQWRAAHHGWVDDQEVVLGQCMRCQKSDIVCRAGNHCQACHPHGRPTYANPTRPRLEWTTCVPSHAIMHGRPALDPLRDEWDRALDEWVVARSRGRARVLHGDAAIGCTSTFVRAMSGIFAGHPFRQLPGG